MTEDEIATEIARLVASGEYRDELYGLPGVATKGGGHFFTPNGERVMRRVYERGSSEYLRAKEKGLVDRLPPLDLASPDAVRDAERLIGHDLPSLLRRLYLDVGNGGFGPGYGLLGIADGHQDDERHTALDIYRGGGFPADLFPLCHWGCAIYSLVHLKDGRVWGFDPNPVEDTTDALHAQDMTLADWFGRWLDRRLPQPWSVQDPETGLWRGATDRDYAEASADL